MASKWFTVKTLYRSYAEGRPEKPDLAYDPDATAVEERILLIKAKSKEDAASKAEREAKDYAEKGTCHNPYNQKIVTYYTGYQDIYEIQGNLSDKREIFSTTRIISKRVADKKIAHIYMGKRKFSYGKGKRRKFINREYTPTGERGLQ